MAEAVEDRKSQLQPKRAESDGAGLQGSSSAAPHGTEGFTGTRKCLGPYRRSLEVKEENARLLGETAAPSRVHTTCLPTTHPAPFVGEEQPSDPGCVRACDMARTQAEASGQRDQTPQGCAVCRQGEREHSGVALRKGPNPVWG